MRVRSWEQLFGHPVAVGADVKGAKAKLWERYRQPGGLWAQIFRFPEELVLQTVGDGAKAESEAETMTLPDSDPEPEPEPKKVVYRVTQILGRNAQEESPCFSTEAEGRAYYAMVDTPDFSYIVLKRITGLDEEGEEEEVLEEQNVRPDDWVCGRCGKSDDTFALDEPELCRGCLDGLVSGPEPEPEPEPLARQQSNASDTTDTPSWF